MNHIRICTAGLTLAVLVLCGTSKADEAGPYRPFYAGPRVATMMTPPGDRDDNLAIGAVAGYQFVACCWAVEAELNTTVTSDGWSGDSAGLFATYRLGYGGRVGADATFATKYKLGVVHRRFTIEGEQARTETDLGGGFGIVMGDQGYMIEIEFSGLVSKSLTADKAGVFAISVLYPL